MPRSADEHQLHDSENSPPITQHPTSEFPPATKYSGIVRTCSIGMPSGAHDNNSVGVDVMKTHARIVCACHGIT